MSWADRLFSKKTAEALRGDYGNLCLLLFLYTLQGIPMGLSASVPLILSANKAGYQAQGIFSLVTWPFSLKLLWAPIVDSYFLPSVGRRKSWLIPVQALCGLSMIFLSSRVSVWLDGEIPDLWSLTYAFLLLYFLMATQDIAVDGWALSLLQEHNRPLASTANAIGQNLGYIIAYIVFLAFSDPDFCNRLRAVPSDVGFVSLSGFLFFFGVIFLLSTAVIWRQRENKTMEKVESARAIYFQCFKVLSLPNVKSLVAILVTQRMGVAMVETVANFKLIELGVPKENLAFAGLLTMPIGVLLPGLIVGWTRERPLRFWLNMHLPRLAMAVIAYAAFAHIKRDVTVVDDPMFYPVLIGILCVFSVVSSCQFVAVMAVFNQISDPRIGGTYMTLLNTVANLASKWTSTVSLWVLAAVSEKTCTDGSDCSSMAGQADCKASGGTCETIKDGFWTLTPFTFVIGIVWFLLAFKPTKRLARARDGWWVHEDGGVDLDAKPTSSAMEKSGSSKAKGGGKRIGSKSSRRRKKSRG